ncbi:TonB family protein [Parvibaculum sp.]|uniref:energy transducer TonB n=1 Tax=Parvibaculum sp. TaxID=2024848 RepID=UPI00320F908B
MAFAATGTAGFYEAGNRSSPRVARLRGPVLRLAAAIALHAGAVAAAISTSAIGPASNAKTEPGPASAIEVVFVREPRKSAQPVAPVAPVAKSAERIVKPVERKVAPKPAQVAMTLPKPADNAAPRPAERESPGSSGPALQPAVAASGSGMDDARIPAAASGETSDLLITNPRFRHPPRPAAYPKRARELGQQGEALIHARLDPDGDPEEVLIWKSSGFALLDNAALAAVRHWQFEPARTNGRATVAWVEIPVRFQLN